MQDTDVSKCENHSGGKWPRYEKDVIDKNGIVLAKKGKPYHVHYIIPLSCGGPHEWWNIHPIPINKIGELWKQGSALMRMRNETRGTK